MILSAAGDAIELVWQGPEHTSFMEDWQAGWEPDDDVRDHVVLCQKKINLRQVLFEAAGVAQILQLFDKSPMVHGVFAMVVVAGLVPVAPYLVRDDEAQLLAVVQRLQQGYIVNEAHVRALLRVQADADRLFEILVSKGFVQRLADGSLKIQRPMLASIRVGNVLP